MIHLFCPSLDYLHTLHHISSLTKDSFVVHCEMTQPSVPPGPPSSAQHPPFQAFLNPRLSALPQSRSLNNSTFNPSDNNQEHGNSDHGSSDLEEGEIPEANLPQLPIASSSLPSSRFRRPPPTIDFPQTDFLYPHDRAQPTSQIEVQTTPFPPFPFPPPFLQSPYRYLRSLPPFRSPKPISLCSNLFTHHTALAQSVAGESLNYDDGTGIFNLHVLTSDISEDQAEAEAERSLEDVLAMGMTYDDLVAEGLHPAFLDELLARVNSHPTSTVPMQPSISNPFLPPGHLTPTSLNAPKVDLSLQAETFLDQLRPTISSSNEGDETKKRGPVSELAELPTKRRAFGRAFGVAVRPSTLVIDVSDDESDDEEEKRAHLPAIKQPPIPSGPRIATPPIGPRPRRAVTIPNRPRLTKEVSPLSTFLF
jgi:hypothetical protein